jgi:hypothetical protein
MKTPLFLVAGMLLGAVSARAAVPSRSTAADSSACDAVKNDPVEGPACLATRGYWKLCRKVIDKSVPALKLTDIPDAYEDKYLSPSEQADVDRATNLRFAAMVTAPISS